MNFVTVMTVIGAIIGLACVLVEASAIGRAIAKAVAWPKDVKLRRTNSQGVEVKEAYLCAPGDHITWAARGHMAVASWFNSSVIFHELHNRAHGVPPVYRTLPAVGIFLVSTAMFVVANGYSLSQSLSLAVIGAATLFVAAELRAYLGHVASVKADDLNVQELIGFVKRP